MSGLRPGEVSVKKMVGGFVAGALIAVVAVAGLAAQGAPAAAQGGGRGPARPEFPTAPQFAASKKAQEHIAVATRIGGRDLAAEVKHFCTATGPQRSALAAQQAGQKPEPDRLLEPIKVFDNLWFIGYSDVGAWVINTSDGIILFDTLNNVDEARDVLIPAIKKIGLNPDRIKHVIIGHAHGDHTGGGPYIQEAYAPQMYMGAPDWDTYVRQARPDRPSMKRGLNATDGQKITLGDTTVTIALTPGHTPGTLAVLVPVKHQGRTTTALIMSGTQMPTDDSVAAFTHVFDDLAKPLGAETMLGGHPDILVNKLPTLEAMGTQYPTGAHPFLMGQERFNRYMAIMLECGRARNAALLEARAQ